MDIRQIAVKFIKTLSSSDKEQLKIMLSHGIMCGADFARQHEVEPHSLSNELKNIFEGK